MKLERAHGTLYMEKISGVGWMLNSIVVDPDFRGHGIGSELMRAALNKCGRPVFLFATNELGGDLRRLRKFYSRFGFVPCRQQKQDLFPYRYNMILTK